MTTRNLLVAVLSFFILAYGSVIAVSAAPPWYTCQVKNIGMSGANVQVQLTDRGGAFTNKYFNIGGDATKGNRALAAGLTALSLEKDVLIYVTDLTPTYPIIQAFYVAN
jgi:hypothetical protein